MQKRIASLLLLLVLMLNVTVPVHAAEENVEYAADEVRTLYLDANPSVFAHNAYFAYLGGLFRVT